MKKIGFWATAALMALAGCGGGSPLASVAQVAGKVLPLAMGDSDTPPPPVVVDPAVFQPEAIAARPDDYVVVTVNAMGVNEMAHRQQLSGDRATFITQSGLQFTLQDGVLLSTRGFGADLVTTGAIDPAALQAVIRAGEGSTTRIVERLTPQGQIESQRFQCVFTAIGPEEVALALSTITANRVNERCTGPQMIFDNIYWLEESGKIAAARQYVSPSVAYLRFNRL
ncbi:hypothetical protein BVG79_02409 [Ketogulonicigenium robustum]|uniref:Lipoprotein n=1 Tax=Ketogulonicigenium robustum TaxID=92947 RepID=A0A1W6P2U1_9RHOB|nr:YjbF family lipoprotein [Ketogulonicigenium robustum]ARO15749.1 hypothetical protein BVG79_02409 [Ketogulonicigenium robustum]